MPQAFPVEGTGLVDLRLWRTAAPILKKLFPLRAAPFAGASANRVFADTSVFFCSANATKTFAASSLVGNSQATISRHLGSPPRAVPKTVVDGSPALASASGDLVFIPVATATPADSNWSSVPSD